MAGKYSIAEGRGNKKKRIKNREGQDMTKNELKQKYTEWNRQITALDQKQKEIFQELQDLCQEKGDGKRWCCLEKLVETLVKAGEGYRPLQLAREYHVIEGQKEALRNFAIATNNF